MQPDPPDTAGPHRDRGDPPEAAGLRPGRTDPHEPAGLRPGRTDPHEPAGLRPGRVSATARGPRRHRGWIVLAALTAAVALALVLRHRHNAIPTGDVPDYRVFSAEAMATKVAAELPDGPNAEAQAKAVFAAFRRVDADMNEWKETSPLGAVNRAAGGAAVQVPKDLRRLLHRGIEIGDLTGGAFDVTWASLWGLWDFKSPAPKLPDSAEVARRVALIDYRQIEIDDATGTVRLPRAGMKIGLGGIAKGFALARAAAALDRRGVKSYLLTAGGQVYARGTKGDRPWRVGIRDPRGAPTDLLASLDLTDASASTSGDYESYFILDGVRYHHILDPRTGMPARGLESATVVSPDPTLADALSTALMVLGPERGLALAERLPDVEAVLVDESGKELLTTGLKGKLIP
jgi:FAD:protein FMN transferase